ncbi:protein kinase [Cryptosporangium sp. NPDC051539]|uniref:protein kinase domain-containing protein n=1 Tax=Cryptosporangium sp. NPDC051539 TaxID=3363962 RepID=UPI0037A1B88C
MTDRPRRWSDSRYRLIEPLGQGGMGRVWRGYDELLHRDVAVKEIVGPLVFSDTEWQGVRERSLREARAIARLDHYNVVRIHDIVMVDGDPWIVMEYVASRSLATVLVEDGRLSPRVAAQIGLAVLGALQAAHEAGVLHRDVKPANILLGEDGRIVLTDFGLATRTDDPRLTRAGAFVGTPAYLAPERLDGADIGPAADLWSLGVTLYEAVEGASPYQRSSVFATLNAVLTQSAPAPTHAGPLGPVIEGLLRKDPEQRLDAAEAEALLRTAIGESVPMPPPAPRSPQAPQAPSITVRRRQARPEDSSGERAPASALWPHAPAFAGSPAASPTSEPGAHAAAVPPPRWGGWLSRRGLYAGVAVVVTLVLVITGGVITKVLGGSACTSHETVRIAAAPEIAPVLREFARSWTGRSGEVCGEVSVVNADPAEVAKNIAAMRQGADGLGAPVRTAELPDVWIPDSSMWLDRLRSAGVDLPIAVGRSLASSPVVLAVPQPQTATLATDGKATTWETLTKTATSGSFRMSILDPAGDAASLSALIALDETESAGSSRRRTAEISLLRTLAAGHSSVRADLIARFPDATDATSLATGLAVAPIPEYELIGYNRGNPGTRLVPVQVTPQPSSMDYPYTLLPGARRGVDELTDDFIAQLNGSQYMAALARSGLRGATGTTGPGFDADPTTPRKITTTQPTRPQIDRTLSRWRVVAQPGRLLTVIDVSGSMKTPVPTADGKSREQVTKEAAAGALALMGDDWSLGLWTFSTDLNGKLPYRQLVPTGPLAAQRAAISSALGGIQATDGDTGLYDTILAAYRQAQAGWDASKSNSILVMTDGKNANPGGLTRAGLIAALKRTIDPKRSIQIIAIGIGEASRTELTQITQVTGGGVFTTGDSSGISDIILQAIALRPGIND